MLPIIALALYNETVYLIPVQSIEQNQAYLSLELLQLIVDLHLSFLMEL